jgi:hypothetical protein
MSSKNIERMAKAARVKGLELCSAEWVVENFEGAWLARVRHGNAVMVFTGKNVGEIIYRINSVNTMALPA